MTIATWSGTTHHKVLSFVRLTKPRVIELLLVTAVPAMIIAQRGMPSATRVAAVVGGGAFAAGGANTINCWMERDRDALMHRTRGRPLPTGDIAPHHALAFGVALNVVAFVVLAIFTNLLAATLALTATLFYVFVYTLWLKPRTPQNIVIGGAAGAMPALIGWAAVRGSIGLAAWCMFAIVFLWTPAHFWALALYYRDDYAAAGVPMLPVVRGPRATGRQILIYAALTVAATLALPVAADASWLYVIVAVVTGVAFVRLGIELARDPTPARAIRFFGWSNVYLLGVFVALACDRLVR